MAYFYKKNFWNLYAIWRIIRPLSMQTVASKEFTSTQKFRKRPEMAPQRVRQIMVELKEYGLRHDLTQRQLASMIGIKPQQLNDWLNGRREPTAERLLVVLEVLRRKPPKPKKK
jgi:DNA-binding transcriptional regulator YiaG